WGKRARPESARTLEEVFAMFPMLKDRHAQRAGTLSGGEQQMCAIGRGLMARPRLLLLDEPALGLAPRLVREVFASLSAIRKTGVTILLVEQNVAHALALADHACVLETGRITLTGLARDLARDPRVKEEFLGVSGV
ncbi:MAG: ATP-binding cassette domain-containing protein, partial [Thermoanaerobaculia bacterium]